MPDWFHFGPPNLPRGERAGNAQVAGQSPVCTGIDGGNQVPQVAHKMQQTIAASNLVTRSTRGSVG
jgi:hypothetical protein